MASIGDTAFSAFARGCVSQGASTPCTQKSEDGKGATCICGLPAENDKTVKNVASGATVVEVDRDRNPAKMKLLHDRLVQWLTRSADDTQSSREQPLRHFHIGVLLVHLNTMYDLVEGLPVAFVWKMRQKGAKNGKTPQLFSWPAALAWSGRQEEEKKQEDRGDEGKSQNPQLVLTKATVALSSDLAQLEVHHAHEVQMVPLTHVTDCWEGLDGTMGSLDDWCVVVELADNQQYPLRFFDRGQVKPFIAVVLALSQLMRDSVPGAAGQLTRASPQERAPIEGPQKIVLPPHLLPEEDVITDQASQSGLAAPSISRGREEWV